MVLREAYLSGQPALPKYLDSGRRKRVSIFGRVMDLDESQKALGRIVVRAEEWGKIIPAVDSTAVFSSRCESSRREAIRREGRAFYVAGTSS